MYWLSFHHCDLSHFLRFPPARDSSHEVAWGFPKSMLTIQHVKGCVKSINLGWPEARGGLWQQLRSDAEVAKSLSHGSNCLHGNHTPVGSRLDPRFDGLILSITE